MPVTYPAYTALIRTDRHDELLEEAVRCLRQQTMPPSHIIFVDSSRNPSCAQSLELLGGKIIRYPNDEFNFSKAINIGIESTETSYTLIISSHTLLTEPSAIEKGWREAARLNIDIAYWYITEEEHFTEIDGKNFNGHNGLSNSCCFIPTAIVAKRPFREEVFSAEDQEWASWYLKNSGKPILQIGTPHLRYANRNALPDINHKKWFNEEIAIAYYAHRRNLWPDKVIARCLRAAFALIKGKKARARFHLAVAKGLVDANFREPKGRSKYF